MNIKVRPYKVEDFDAVNKILEDNFGHGRVNVSNDSVHEYVCCEEDKVLGYFILTSVINVVRGFEYYLLDYVCVDKDSQGKGIGSIMMQSVCDIADSNKVEYVKLTCSNGRCAAQHLYQKYGFVKYDTNVFRRVTE